MHKQGRGAIVCLPQDRRPLITVFVLTYALSWWAVPLGSFIATGPLIAALIVIPFTWGLASLLYGVVWCAVALGLVVLDGWLWGGPTPSSAKGLPAYGGESQVS